MATKPLKEWQVSLWIVLKDGQPFDYAFSRASAFNEAKEQRKARPLHFWSVAPAKVQAGQSEPVRVSPREERLMMRCEDCRWWDNSTQHGSAEPDTTGMCRVRPPVADERDCTARWPFTQDTDWCARFANLPGASDAAPETAVAIATSKSDAGEKS